MWRKFYNLYIAPRQGHEDAGNREFVLNVLLAGTFTVMVFAFLSLLQSYFLLGHHFVLPRIVSVVVMLGIVGGMYALSRSGKYKLAAYSFIALYFLIAVGVSMSWGLTMPVTVVLFGLIVVLAGILIGARHSLYGFGAVVLAMLALNMLEAKSISNPDWSWMDDPSNSGMLIGVVMVFGIIAIVSWLFNYRMERSLHRAERAEAALKRQKAQLEKTVEKRTRELQEAQLEKVQELYRFAELGQISTALMHELANHLTTLTFDIESLEAENRSRMLTRAKRSMHYIDKMVIQVRDQLRGKTRMRVFNVAAETQTVIGILQHKAAQGGVHVVWEVLKNEDRLRTKGDPLRFRQLLANIISNGIDAYKELKTDPKQVLITATTKGDFITVKVEDWAKGIQPEDRPKLFDPFFGTKKGGLGLGLFISRQIAQDHFGGNITLDTSKSHTVFVITLKAYEPAP